jgi:hypothetical protein
MNDPERASALSPEEMIIKTLAHFQTGSNKLGLIQLCVAAGCSSHLEAETIIDDLLAQKILIRYESGDKTMYSLNKKLFSKGLRKTH